MGYYVLGNLVCLEIRYKKPCAKQLEFLVSPSGILAYELCEEYGDRERGKRGREII